jgi:tetratricopeptide (TPR) repeat protein
MTTSQNEWEARVAAIWQRAASMHGEDLVQAIDALADERSRDDGLALFERACARDTAGDEAEAERYYRAALLTQDLDAYRRSRAVIQLASTLRILGRLQESEQLLIEELDRHLAAGTEQPLHDEARATLALTFVAQGRAAEAAGLALCTLAPRLSRYNRSIFGNASLLVSKTWT